MKQNLRYKLGETHEKVTTKGAGVSRTQLKSPEK